MKIGTVEEISEFENQPRSRSRFASSISGGPSTGGGDGPDSDGPDKPGFPANDEAEPRQIDKSKYIAWFLLLAIGMTFAGLLGAYLMISTNKAAEWQPFELPLQVWISTAIILASSVTYTLGRRGIDRDRFEAGRKWLLVTTVFGALFVSSQLVLWLELVNQGLYMSGNPYAGFFYVLTATHLVHVLGGIAALSSILLKAWYPPQSIVDLTRRRDLARSVGWYWHFMGALWVVLLLMLGFWK